MIGNGITALSARGGKVKDLEEKLSNLNRECHRYELDAAEKQRARDLRVQSIIDSWLSYADEVEDVYWEIKKRVRNGDTDTSSWPVLPNKPSREY